MLVIGLTGGIASGKTTISNLFLSLDIPVIDTDVISRQLMEPEQPGYQNTIKKLGISILHDDGSIDRRKLRHRVFSDSSLKDWLESMLHPLIYQIALDQINQYPEAAYVILVVPLLFESGFDSLADRVLVVDCSRETQLKRLVARDNIDTKLAEYMLDQQLSNQERLGRADDIILNNGNDDLKAQVTSIHQQYLSIA